MNQKYTYFSKNVLFFTVGSFVPKLLQFILVPLYTHCLTTAEYGTADLISVTVSLCVPVFTLGIQDAVLRFALDDRYRREDVLSVAVKIILTGFLVLLAIAFSLRFLGFEFPYLGFFLAMYLISALSNSVSLFCRGTDRVAVMVTAGILHTAVSLTANIILLTWLRWGLEGFLLAGILGSAASLVYCVCKARLWQYIVLRTPGKVFRAMTVFSIPLIFNVIAWWVNSALDKYILTWISGVAVSGVYAIAYKIPNILSVFQGVFFQAWSISAVKEFDSQDEDGFLSNMYSLVSFAMAAACSGIMLLNIPLAKLLYAKEFFQAWQYCAPLMVSAVFHAMSLFVGSIFTAVKDTKTLAVSTALGAALNTVLNLILIPRFSAYGAAVATLVDYGAVWSIRRLVLRKHIRMRVSWYKEVVVYLLLVVQMWIAAMGASATPLQLLPLLGILWLNRKELAGGCRWLVKKGVSAIRGKR